MSVHLQKTANRITKISPKVRLNVKCHENAATSTIHHILYTALFTIILAENININSDTQNKDINKLIN